ncbi:MAG: hypothetical protein KBD31_00475 [Proteobacteria bacterium]|nr:hypothetical protein [Pseudomonadota bacterium]
MLKTIYRGSIFFVSYVFHIATMIAAQSSADFILKNCLSEEDLSILSSEKLLNNPDFDMLTSGMILNDKETISRSFIKIETQDQKKFVETVLAFTNQADIKNRYFVTLAFGEIGLNKWANPDFVRCIQSLSMGSSSSDLFNLIIKIADIPERYITNELFINFVNKLSKRMPMEEKIKVIDAILRVDDGEYNDFDLLIGRICADLSYSPFRSIVIEALSHVDALRYSKEFVHATLAFSQNMNANQRSFVIKGLSRIRLLAYPSFLESVKTLTQHMNDADKARSILVFSEVSENAYKPFLNAFLKLSTTCGSDQDKMPLINALKEIDSDYYNEFLRAIDLLSLGLNRKNRMKMVHLLKKENPLNFINLAETANRIYGISTIGDKGERKVFILEGLCHVPSQFYPNLVRFFAQHRDFFSYIPACRFADAMNQNQNIQTEEQLNNALLHLCALYNYEDFEQRLRGQQRQMGLAFMVHILADTPVINHKGEVKKFIKSVIDIVNNRISNDLLAYDVIIQLLNVEIEDLLKDPQKNVSITRDVFEWILRTNNVLSERENMQSVVTYLQKISPDHQKIRLWLYTFMEESAKAYDSEKNPTSCIKGVNERVITSLRSVIEEINDPELYSIIKQAENDLFISVKINQLKNYEFWAKILFEKGVRSTSFIADAQQSFKDALDSYFEGFEKNESFNAEIEAIFDSFEDSQPDLNDGLWFQLKSEIEKLEHSTSK